VYFLATVGTRTMQHTSALEKVCKEIGDSLKPCYEPGDRNTFLKKLDLSSLDSRCK
ncbi:hypothetical protein SK128_024451, partial [Halocaridina rubra]